MSTEIDRGTLPPTPPPPPLKDMHEYDRLDTDPGAGESSVAGVLSFVLGRVRCEECVPVQLLLRLLVRTVF